MVNTMPNMAQPPMGAQQQMNPGMTLEAPTALDVGEANKFGVQMTAMGRAALMQKLAASHTPGAPILGMAPPPGPPPTGMPPGETIV